MKLLKENMVLEYDESEILENEIKFKIEEQEENLKSGELSEEDKQTEEQIKDNIYSFGDCLNFAWEDFNFALDELITEIDKHKREFWKVKGFNMGWRNLQGFKTFQATNSQEMLKAILPNTSEFTLRVWKTKTQLILKVYHHDAPMGETYFIKPLNQKELKEELNQ